MYGVDGTTLRTSIEIMGLFQELNNDGATILLVTHELDIARYAKRRIEMRDGVIIEDVPIEHRREAIEDLANFHGATGI